MPEVFGTTCAAGWATGVPPLTAGGMTSLLLLLPEGSAAMTIPVTAAAATTMAPMVIRLRRRSARRCWARIWATFSRARCLFLAPLDISACLSSSRSPKEDRLPSQPVTQNPQRAGWQPKPAGMLAGVWAEPAASSLLGQSAVAASGAGAFALDAAFMPAVDSGVQACLLSGRPAGPEGPDRAGDDQPQDRRVRIQERRRGHRTVSPATVVGPGDCR